MPDSIADRAASAASSSPSVFSSASARSRFAEATRRGQDRLIVPAELPSESSAVWRRHGRCAEVLAELFELS